MKSLHVKVSEKVVFYENKGILFAARAYWMLKVYGHNNVYILNGDL